MQNPLGVLVWMIAVEHLHHGAEIGALRDIHRGHARNDPVPAPDFPRWTTTPWRVPASGNRAHLCE